MTEREKALAGEWYDAAGDAELRGIMKRTQELLYRLNALPPGERAARDALLRQILGAVGRDCQVLTPFYCDYGVNIRVGDAFFMNKGCHVLDGGSVSFGNHVFVGPMCGFHTAIHPLDAERRNRALERAEPIVVEDDVWIGAQACVLPGVRIGRGAVVGAGSVVTHDVPPLTVAAGNPCRVIRSL